jgi:tetratricopeptide (TPR) repeat protein
VHFYETFILMKDSKLDNMNSSTFGELLSILRKQRKISQIELAKKLDLHRNTISQWERGICLPDNRTIVLELSRQLALNTHDTRNLLEASLTAIAPYWYIPYRRNPFFTGRESVLQELHNVLGTACSATFSQSYALSGLGGIGKTQTVIEYAYRYANEYSATLWINAETTESIASSLIAIADLLKLPEKQEQNRIVAAIMQWLTNHSQWLLIFDNVEDPELVKDVLPATRHGSLLFTSRKQALGLAAKTLNLEQMTVEEGTYFLLRRAKLLTSMASLDCLASTDLALAQEIVSIMNGLPLALDQASAYIEATQCSLSGYLQLFQSSQMRLLDERDSYVDHSLSVVRTFSLTFELLEQSYPAAIELLTACAFLAPEAIPETIFQEGHIHLGAILEMLVSDSFEFSQSIKALLSYSLLQRNANTQTLMMHRLVQIVLRKRLPKDIQRIWTGRVLRTMNQLFPSSEAHINYCQICESLLPHALMCILLSEQWQEDVVLRITLTSHVASYLVYRARYAEAEPLLLQALYIGEYTLDSEHDSMVEIFYKLGVLYEMQGKYKEAEALLLRALRIQEKTSGTEHLLVARLLNRLAELYRAQGKYAEARSLYQSALRIRENSLGSEHHLTAPLLNNLALLCWQEGKYEEAETLHQRASHIWEQALGPMHPEVAHSLNNLANIYVEQGKYEEAETLYQRALHIWEQALGPMHPEVAHPLNNLANTYLEQGKYEEVEPLLQRALNIWEQALGSNHPLVAHPLAALGDLYNIQEHYEQAEPLYQRALDIWKQTLGSEHSDLARPLIGIAKILNAKSHYEQAEQLYQRALALCQHQLGPHHPYVAEILYHLALFYQEQCQITESLSLCQQALAIYESAFGPHHPKTKATFIAYQHLLQETRCTEEVTQMEFKTIE